MSRGEPMELIMDKITTAITDIYDAGYRRGFDIASWQDLPDIGAKTDRSVDYEGIKIIKDIDDAHSYFSMLCICAEENNRSYSPFEFTAKEINDLDYSDEAWTAFDEGINAGFEANWKSRADQYYGDI